MLTKRTIIGLLLGGVAIASAAQPRCEKLKDNKEFAKNTVIECAETNGKKMKFKGDVDIRNNIDGEIVIANDKKPQKLKLKKGKKIKKLVIGESPAEVILETDLWVGELVINPEAILRTNGHNVEVGNGQMKVDGSLDADGSTVLAHDVSFGADSSFVPSKALVLSGTGHKIIIPATYALQATYSGSLVDDEWVQNDIVLVATGTLLTATGARFTSYVYVAPVLSGTGFELARYAEQAIYECDMEECTDTLLYATGALLPSAKPNIGFQDGGWVIPYYEPAVSLGNVTIKQ